MSEERIAGITCDVKPIQTRSAFLEDETSRVYQIISESINFSYGLIDPSVHKEKQLTDEEKLDSINQKWEETLGQLATVSDKQANKNAYVRLHDRYRLYSTEKITLMNFLKTADEISKDIVKEISDGR